MSDRYPVHLLDPAGATDGQVPQYDAASGRVAWADGSTGGAGALAVEDEGAEVVAAAARLNFTGAGVAVSDSGSGEVQVAIPGGGGGGGGGWATALDLPLNSLTDWPSGIGTGVGAGTWTADANGIHRTDASSTSRRYYSASRYALAAFVLECDIRLDGGAAGTAGLTTRVPLTGDSGGHRVHLVGNGTNVTAIGMERDAQTALGTYNLDAPIPYGTWITLRLATYGIWTSVYIDGVLLTNVQLNNPSITNGPRIGLAGYNTAASWRNLTLWTPAQP